MSEPIKVANVGDIEADEALVVTAAANGTDDDIAVFFTEGRYFAIDDTCTHQLASLADGWVEACEVECPLHFARFSLATGRALCPPASRPVGTHRVELRGDEIWLYPGEPA